MSEKVVLMFLANDFYTDPRVKQEAMSLIKAGFKVHVLAWDREGKFDSLNLRDKLFVKNLKFLSRKSFGKIRYALAALLLQVYEVFYGIKLIRKYGKIIIHANDFNTLVGAYILKTLFPNNVRLVYDSHELTPAVYEDWYSKGLAEVIYAMEYKLVKQVDQVFVVSPLHKRYFELISNTPIEVIYNLPSQKDIPKVSKMQAREMLNLPKDKIIISFVGVIRPDYALKELLIAVKNFKEQNKEVSKLYFVIVGNGPDKEELKNLITKYGLSDLVTLVPEVPHDVALLYILASDFSYAVYRKQKFNMKTTLPWKLFESLACKTKIIAKEDSYLGKFVIENKCGFVIDELKTENILFLLNRIVQTNNFDFANCFNTHTNVTWESQEIKFVKIYNDLFKDLLGGSK